MKKALFLASIVSSCLQAADIPQASQPQLYKASITSFADLPQALANCDVDLKDERDSRTDMCAAIDFDETIVCKVVHLPGGKKLFLLLNGEIKAPDEEAYREAVKVKKELGLKEDDDLAVEALIAGGYAHAMLQTHNIMYPDQDLPAAFQSDIVPTEKILAKELIKKSCQYAYLEDKEIIKRIIKKLQNNGAFVTVASAGQNTRDRGTLAADVAIRFWLTGTRKFENMHGTSSRPTLQDTTGKEMNECKALEKQQEIMSHGMQKPIEQFKTYLLVDNSEASIDEFLQHASKHAPAGSKVIGMVYRPEVYAVTAEKLLDEYNTIIGKTAPSNNESNCIVM